MKLKFNSGKLLSCCRDCKVFNSKIMKGDGVLVRIVGTHASHSWYCCMTVCHAWLVPPLPLLTTKSYITQPGYCGLAPHHLWPQATCYSLLRHASISPNRGISNISSELKSFAEQCVCSSNSHQHLNKLESI